MIIDKLKRNLLEQNSMKVDNCLRKIDILLENENEVEGIEAATFVKIIEEKWDRSGIYVYAIDILKKLSADFAQYNKIILCALDDYTSSGGKYEDLERFSDLTAVDYISTTVLLLSKSFCKSDLPLIKSKFDELKADASRLNLAATIYLVAGDEERQYLEFVRESAKSSCEVVSKYAENCLEIVNDLKYN